MMVAIKIAAFGGKLLAKFGQAECRQKYFLRVLWEVFEKKSPFSFRTRRDNGGIKSRKTEKGLTALHVSP